MMNKLLSLLLCAFCFSELGASSIQQRRDQAASKLAESQSYNPDKYYTLKGGFIFCVKERCKKLNNAFKQVIPSFDDQLASKAQLKEQLALIEDQYPSSFQKSYNLGVLTYKLQDYPAAEIHFTLAYRLQPLYWKTALWLGKTTQLKGDYRSSEQWLKLAYRLNPDDFTSLVQLADIYLETDQNLKLNSLTSYVRFQKPNSPEILLLLGKIEMRNKRYQKAYEYFSDKLSQSIEARYLAYRSAFLSKNFPEAEHYLQETIKEWKVNNSFSVSRMELEAKLSHLHQLMLKESSE